MITKNVNVGLASGLEARTVAMLVQIASQYESSVYIEHGTKKINAKSIMGMMSLAVNAGEEIVVIADGEDENIAVESMEKYLVQ